MDIAATVAFGGRVKHQYVGDINDYRKYALLRALSADSLNRIGVCWMLTSPDDSSDGNKLGYLENPEQHRDFDPELFDILAHAAAEPDRRRLHTIEDSGVIAGALYYNAELPQQLNERVRYMAACRAMFAEVDMVFFDPDNGIEVPSSRIGLKTGLKYIFLDEIEAFYAEGKSILIYQHFPQMKVRDVVIASGVQQLRNIASNAAIWLFRTANVVFFLLVHPESPARLAIAAMEAGHRWEGGGFIQSRYLGVGGVLAG